MSDTLHKAPFAGPTIRFLFNICNDIAATREFYTDMLGLKETSYDAAWGYLCYQCEGFEFMFFKSELGDAPVPDQWATQPGYEGGKMEITSWSIYIPEAQFEGAVNRLRAGEVKQFKPQPEWRQNSYWGFTVMDPNGVTVEVYTIPAEKPTVTEWSE